MKPSRTPLAGRTALVTGASSGIGREIARGLARKGVRMALTARRVDRLQALAAEIARDGHPEPIIFIQDLAAPGAAELLYRATRAALGPIDLLINNAAAGLYGAVHEADRESLARLVALNVGSLVELTQLALPEMIARRSGSILQIASTAAFVPLPYMATYAATKAFVLSFSEAVHAEVSQHGVEVICFCPDRTATEFQQAAGYEGRAPGGARTGGMSAETVAADAITALERGGRVRYAGFWNQVIAGLGRHVPRRLVLAAGARLMRPRR